MRPSLLPRLRAFSPLFRPFLSSPFRVNVLNSAQKSFASSTMASESTIFDKILAKEVCVRGCVVLYPVQLRACVIAAVFLTRFEAQRLCKECLCVFV